MKIRRRCKCGCSNITNPGKKYILGHNRSGQKLSKEHKKNISLALMGNANGAGNTSWLDKKHSEESKLKMSLAQSLAQIGNTNLLGHKHSKKAKFKMSLAKQNQSKETKLKISLSKIKYDPNYEYCDIWKDREYKKDIRKNYCENKNCKGKSKRLNNHHIYLDKKRCAPNEVMTLCASCHSTLHCLLQGISTNPKDYIIINRPDYISYIHKESRNIIKINKIF